MQCFNIKRSVPFMVIIADDLTGALDTSIKFAEHESAAIVISTQSPDELSGYLTGDHDVVCVNAATRHLQPRRAYEVVASLTECCVKHDVPYIYKKTDSVLRGNIASELQALLDSSKSEFIPFVPAYPEMKRTVENGVMYVNGVPLSRTKLAEDPFQKIISSNARDIFSSSMSVKSSLPYSYIPEPGDSGVLIYDGKTKEEALKTADNLLESGVRVFSGCGGFAEALAVSMLGEGYRKTNLDLCPLLILCGSVNDVSKKQIAALVKDGYRRVSLDGSALARCTPDDFEVIAESVASEMKRGNILILDTKASSESVTDDGLDAAEKVSEALGSIAYKALEKASFPLFVIGGDTLLSVLNQYGKAVIEPICEIESGVVLSYIHKDEKTITLLSKSGGFGTERLISDLISGKTIRQEEII